MNSGISVRASARPEDSTLSLWRRYRRQGDPAARTELLERHLDFVDSKRSLLRHAEAVALNDLLGDEHTYMQARFGDMADRIYPQIEPYDDSDVLDPDGNFAQRLIDGYFARFMR